MGKTEMVEPNSELAPLIDPRLLERRLVDEQRSSVLIVTAATEPQRRLFAEFAREVAGELLVEPDEPARPIRATAPSAVERGFTVSVVQIESADQAERHLDILRRAPRQRYRGFVLVTPPELPMDPRGPLFPWVQPGMLVCASSNDADAPFPDPSRYERVRG